MGDKILGGILQVTILLGILLLIPGLGIIGWSYYLAARETETITEEAQTEETVSINETEALVEEMASDKSKQEYVEDLLQIDLQDYVLEGTWEITDTDGEEYAYICLTLEPDSFEEVESVLTESLGKPLSPDECVIPGYNGNELAQQMKAQEIKDIFVHFEEGSEAKTRSIEVYLTQDEEGNGYLYLFG